MLFGCGVGELSSSRETPWLPWGDEITTSYSYGAGEQRVVSGNLFVDSAFNRGIKAHRDSNISELCADLFDPSCGTALQGPWPDAQWMVHEVTNNTFLAHGQCKTNDEDRFECFYPDAKSIKSPSQGKLKVHFDTAAEKNGGCELDLTARNPATTWPHFGYEQKFSRPLNFVEGSSSYDYRFSAKLTVESVNVESWLECNKERCRVKFEGPPDLNPETCRVDPEACAAECDSSLLYEWNSDPAVNACVPLVCRTKSSSECGQEHRCEWVDGACRKVQCADLGQQECTSEKRNEVCEWKSDEASWRTGEDAAADHLYLHATFPVTRKDRTPNGGEDFYYLTFVLCDAEGPNHCKALPSERGNTSEKDAWIMGDQFGAKVRFTHQPVRVGEKSAVSFELRSALQGLLDEVNKPCSETNPDTKHCCSPQTDVAESGHCALNQHWDAKSKSCLCDVDVETVAVATVEDFEILNMHSLIESWGRVQIDYEIEDLMLERIDPDAHLRGHVDGINAGGCAGWIYEPQREEQPVIVGVFVDERYLFYKAADEHRPDLGTIGIGPSHGFTFDFAGGCYDKENGYQLTTLPGGPHSYEIIAADSGGGIERLWCSTGASTNPKLEPCSGQPNL